MKKLFLTAAIFFSLSGAAYAAPDRENDYEPQSEVIVENADVSSSTVIDLAAPAEEPTVLPESGIAKKMTQAEKAHNAAVNDSWGGAITIVAMLIVVMALVVLSVLFLGFGKISEYLMSKKKRQSAKNTNPAAADDVRPEVDSGDAIAAIALALSEHFGDGHDMEETILTIRRMKKAYSPWNSKIYNLRQMPEIDKNTPSRSAF